MSRNRYTRHVHDEQRKQIVHQEKKLAALAQELHQPQATQPETLPVTDIAKERRRIRRDLNLRHKPARSTSTPPQSPEQGARTAA